MGSIRTEPVINGNGIYSNGTNGHDIGDAHGQAKSFPVAICGMACRLPGGVETPQQMWDFLMAKGDARSTVPESRYNIEAFHSMSGKAGTIKTQHGYFLDNNVDLGSLDSSCFSIPRGELERVDPHQRQMLEVARECLDDAGEVNVRGGLVGCYMGSFGEDWCEMFAKDNQQYGVYRVSGYGDFMLSNRVSYEMDLRGPSMTIRTGCSAALVGLHEACAAMERGDCTSAIVGGANLILAPGMTAAMTEQGVLSPEGSCKTFSANADGYARGEAINAVYVKPLHLAVRDGNPIRAVIRSTASNNDGKTPGISYPSTQAQEAMIRRAYEVAGISDFSQTGFVECHGTGTAIGDPIEINAIARVFGDSGVYIGSVKPNLGHSEGASGLTSLIKTVLALEKQTIPANIKFSEPNPKIPFQDRKLVVPVEATPWPSHCRERAGVNSFGIGGSNVHVIVDSAREYQHQQRLDRYPNLAKLEERQLYQPESPQLLLYSANSAQSLSQMVKNYQSFLSTRPETVADVAYTLANNREHMPYRAFEISGRSSSGLTATNKTPSSPPSIVMVFTGQGAQWPQMGRDLLSSNAVFCESIRRLDSYLQAAPEPVPWSIEGELRKSVKQSQLHKAEFSQPICTAVQVALVDTLAAFKVQPCAVVGHSSGEIAAAYAAGALTASEAILTAWRRGSIVASATTRSGAMAAIGMGWGEVEEFLLPNVTVACDNSPGSVTLSGDAEVLNTVVSNIRQARPSVLARLLKVDKAYHSHHMAEIGESYHASISGLLKRASESQPVKHFFSSVTGGLLDPETHLDARYWQRNLESPVLFQAAINSILAHPIAQNNPLFLEVGPHSAMAGPIRQILASQNFTTATYVSTLIRNQDSTESLLETVGKLFTAGVSLGLETLAVKGARVLPDLPRYPWNHEDSFWYESRISKQWRQRKFAHHDLLGLRQLESSDLEPSWRNILHIQNVEWLRDHRIEDDIVFPCAGYIAMAGEAVRQVTGFEEGFTLRHLIISAALVLTEGKPVEFITTLRPHRLMDSLNSQWWEFSIVSHNHHGVWTTHCTGEVTTQQTSSTRLSAGTHNLSEVAGLERGLDKRKYYDFMRNAGNHYGPCFQIMEDIKAGTREHVAAAKVVNNTRGDEAFYHLHPTIVDACLQLFSMAALNGYTHANKYSKVVPTKIDLLTIASCREENIDIKVSAVLDRRGDLFGSGQCAVTNGRHILQLEGALLSAIDERSEPKNNADETPSTARYIWGPHIDFLDAKELIRPAIDRALSTPILDELTSLCLEYSHQQLAGVSTKEALPHLQKFRGWIEQRLSLNDNTTPSGDVSQTQGLDVSDRITHLVRKLAGTPAAGSAVAMQKVVSNLPGIFSGDTDALEILMKDGTLTELYKFTDECDRSPFIRALSHSKPSLRVLEIGAGTGASTSSILKDLFLPSGQCLYSKYTFTDISAGFFAPAKERFKGLPNMEFTTLDISKSPDSQGFEGRKYDLIIATNVLHATANLGETLGNVLHLLAPDGRLLLHELSSPCKWVNFVFGTLPGWWCGEADGRTDEPYISVQRWDAELQAAGFQSLDVAVLDSQEPHHLNAIMVARPQVKDTSTPPIKTTKNALTLLVFPDDMDFTAEVSGQLQARGYAVDIRHLHDTPLPSGQDVISLLECRRPFLDKIRSVYFESFKQVVKDLSAGDDGMLWVTGLSQIHCKDPRYGQIIGAARTIRSEMMIDFATCEVDDFSSSGEQIADVFEKFHIARINAKSAAISPAAGTTFKPDFEYAIVNQVVNIGRFYPFSLPTELLVEKDESDRLTLQIAKPGRITSLEWSRSPVRDLQGDEIEVETYAAGLNFRDVLGALGIVELPVEGFGLEASGIVSRVGPNVKETSVGDRVMLFGRGAFSTHVVASEKLSAKLSDDLSFVDAATMPCVYATAIYSLFNVGRLQKGESVLIHSACGGVGLAAIQLAKMVGAEIFVTVGNDEKVKHLMETFDLPRNRIFNSRNDSFVRDVMRETDGRGVDVALNSLSGELLHATWQCIAEFGTMLEIGKRDLLGSAKLDMDVFLANRSYCCVDLDQICQKKPSVCNSLLKSIMDYFRQGHILPIGPATVFSGSKVQEAFRYMQQGLHIGKIVISLKDTPGDHDVIEAAAAKRRKTLKLDSTASYLLIGGLGGLGQAVSRYMAEHNAKRLVYLSRSAGLNPTDQVFAQELESMGCEVVMVKGNVTSEEDVSRALQISPNLKGIVQLSMVLRDQAFPRMTIEEWDGAASAKVQGTWNLHNAAEAAGADLDFFLLFSSMSGIIGQPGQANYAGANTFLDAFVQFRTSLGLAASSIDIGAVEDIGYISNNDDLLRKMKTSSAYAVREEELLEAAGSAMMMSSSAKPSGPGNGTQFVARNTFVLGLGSNVPLSSPDSRAIWRTDRRMAVYHNAAGADNDSAASGGSDTLKTFLNNARGNPSSLKTAESARLLTMEIGRRLFDFLLRPEDDLQNSGGVSLALLGMDSLVAIEMRTWWRQTFGFDISVLEMLGMGTLEALGKHAAEGLLRGAEGVGQ